MTDNFLAITHEVLKGGERGVVGVGNAAGNSFAITLGVRGRGEIAGAR
jgi:hypothetical protein